MTHYVFSTHATDIAYAEYIPGPQGGLPTVGRSVTIKGGANVANKLLVTPRGVVTPVTDDEMDFLLGDAQFQAHEKAGFIQFDSRKADPEEIARGMNGNDKSRPLTDADYRPGGRAVTKSLSGDLMKAPATRESKAA